MSLMSIYEMGFQSQPEEKKEIRGTRRGGTYKNGGKVTGSRRKTKHRAKTTNGRHKGY